MKRRDSDDNSLALKFVFEMHPGFVIFWVKNLTVDITLSFNVLVTLSLVTFQNFLIKNLHDYCQIIPQYFLQIMFKSIEI